MLSDLSGHRLFRVSQWLKFKVGQEPVRQREHGGIVNVVTVAISLLLAIRIQKRGKAVLWHCCSKLHHHCSLCVIGGNKRQDLVH